MLHNPILSANVRSPPAYGWLNPPRFRPLLPPPAPLPVPFRFENRSRSRSRSRSFSLSRSRSRTLSLTQSLSRCFSRSRSCDMRGRVLESSSISIFAVSLARNSEGGMCGDREASFLIGAGCVGACACGGGCLVEFTGFEGGGGRETLEWAGDILMLASGASRGFLCARGPVGGGFERPLLTDGPCGCMLWWC